MIKVKLSASFCFTAQQRIWMHAVAVINVARYLSLRCSSMLQSRLSCNEETFSVNYPSMAALPDLKPSCKPCQETVIHSYLSNQYHWWRCFVKLTSHSDRQEHHSEMCPPLRQANCSSGGYRRLSPTNAFCLSPQKTYCFIDFFLGTLETFFSATSRNTKLPVD